MALSTSTASPALRPVELFFSQVIVLEASLLRAAADPSEPNVHHLRTNTRRMEAQLELLGALPELHQLLEDHAKPLRQVRRALRSVRREAGRVRDMDVQSGLLAGLAESQPGTPVAKQASSLARHLGEGRQDEAKVLARMLRKHGHAFVRHLEALGKALADRDELTLTPERLDEIATSLYSARSPEPPSLNSPDTRLDEDQLHDIRKAAKLTRYLLEAKAAGVSEEGSASDQVKRRAKAFERLQGAGGEWHDALTLAELARDHHGKKSELAQHLVAHREAALATYLDKLRSFS